MLQGAILDDYQNVAQKVADWSPIAKDVEIKVFTEPWALRTRSIEALRTSTSSA